MLTRSSPDVARPGARRRRARLRGRRAGSRSRSRGARSCRARSRRARAGRAGRRRRRCRGRAGRAGAARRAGSAGRRACRAAVAVISSRSASRRFLIVPSSSFSATLPVKPSVTTTSAAPASRSRPSVLPSKLRSLGGEQLVRLERQLVALLRLLADREQAHLRVRERRGSPPRRRRPCAELEQVLGAGVGVRAGVEQHRRAATRRNRHGDRRTADAGQPAELEQARREHRAGVPGRDDGVGLVLRRRPARGDERAVRLRAHRLGRLLVHRDHVGRLDELEPVRVERRRADDDRDDPSRRRQRAGDDLLRPGRRPWRRRRRGSRRLPAVGRRRATSRLDEASRSEQGRWAHRARVALQAQPLAALQQPRSRAWPAAAPPRPWRRCARGGRGIRVPPRLCGRSPDSRSRSRCVLQSGTSGRASTVARQTFSARRLASRCCAAALAARRRLGRLLLGDCHRSRASDNAALTARARSRSPRARPSASRSAPPRARAARRSGSCRTPGRGPAQSARQRILSGSASATRVARPGREVELVVDEIRRLQLVGALGVGRLVLARGDRQLEHRVAEAAVARAVQPPCELQLEDGAGARLGDRELGRRPSRARADSARRQARTAPARARSRRGTPLPSRSLT